MKFTEALMLGAMLLRPVPGQVLDVTGEGGCAHGMAGINMCDGDVCITGECIFELACGGPRVGQRIKMWGVSRKDPEYGRVPNHNLGEIHPAWWAPCETVACDEVQPK